MPPQQMPNPAGPLPQQPSFQQPVPQQPLPQPAPVPQQTQPSYPSSVGQSPPIFPLLSCVIGAVAVIALSVLLGYLLTNSSALLMLIPVVLGLGAAGLGYISIDKNGALNKLALIGLVLGLVAASVSLSWVVGQKVADSKIKAAASSYSNSY